MSRQFVQGDIMFVERILKLPGDCKKMPQVRGRYVIARGEKTGHTHEVDTQLATLFGVANGMVIVVDAEEAPVVHQKHPPLVLPQGQYNVIQQREEAPRRMPMNVMD
jgi:hypothetical protein